MAHVFLGPESAQGENSSFFFKQKTAYEVTTRLVGSEMCIRDSFLPVPWLVSAAVV